MALCFLSQFDAERFNKASPPMKPRLKLCLVALTLVGTACHRGIREPDPPTDSQLEQEDGKGAQQLGLAQLITRSLIYTRR